MNDTNHFPLFTVWFICDETDKAMVRNTTSPIRENKTVFQEEDLPLFFCDDSVAYEDDMIFINEGILDLTEEEHGVYEDHIFYENSELFLLHDSMILLVMHVLFIIWSKLNDTLGRQSE